MQLTYEVDARRRKLLFINVGKYFSAFPVIWLGGFQAMRHHVGARYVSPMYVDRLDSHVDLSYFVAEHEN